MQCIKMVANSKEVKSKPCIVKIAIKASLRFKPWWHRVLREVVLTVNCRRHNIDLSWYVIKDYKIFVEDYKELQPSYVTITLFKLIKTTIFLFQDLCFSLQLVIWCLIKNVSIYYQIDQNDEQKLPNELPNWTKIFK